MRTLSRRQLFSFDFPARDLPTNHWVRVHRTAMACRFEVVLSGERAHDVPAARHALDEADRIEAALTVFRDTSALTYVNRHAGNGPVDVDQEVFDLLGVCRTLSERTGGAFDITSTPLSRCWGFLRREGRLPTGDEIARARAQVGWDGLELDPMRRTVRFARAGMELNLGSIGKGYAIGRMAALLADQGVGRALLSAGGSSVFALGSGSSGDGWRVDLHSRCRRDAGGPLAQLSLRNVALATSGVGEQFVDVSGTRFGHVLDPRTGWPTAGMLSASVVTRDPAEADALSTAFLVGGPALAEPYCEANPDIMAILVLDEAEGRTVLYGQCTGVTVH